MRELRGAGHVVVRHIPGDTNPADLFTKILTKQPFEKHRKFVLNLAASRVTLVWSLPAVPARLPPTPRPRVRGQANRELWLRVVGVDPGQARRSRG